MPLNFIEALKVLGFEEDNALLLTEKEIANAYQKQLSKIGEAYKKLSTKNVKSEKWYTDPNSVFIENKINKEFRVEKKGDKLNVFKIFNFDKIAENHDDYDYLVEDPIKLQELYDKLANECMPSDHDSLFEKRVKLAGLKLLAESHYILSSAEERKEYKAAFIPSEDEVNIAINRKIKIGVTNYYKALNIPSDADSKTIKEAYLKYRKDSESTHSTALTLNQAYINKERQKFIDEAFNILNDPEKRADYDVKYQRVFNIQPVLPSFQSSFPLFRPSFDPALSQRGLKRNFPGSQNNNIQFFQKHCNIPRCLNKPDLKKLFNWFYQQQNSNQVITYDHFKCLPARETGHWDDTISKKIGKLKKEGLINYTISHGRMPDGDVYPTEKGWDLFNKLKEMGTAGVDLPNKRFK